MKTIYSPMKLTVMIGLAVIIAGASTYPAFAIEGSGHTTVTPTTKQTEQETESTSNSKLTEVCTHFKNLDDSSRSTLKTRSSELQGDFKKRLTTLSDGQKTVDQKVTTARNDSKSEFEIRVNKLKSTDGLSAVQLQAIDTYVTNMKQAEAIRQAAVDAARTTYRTDLAALITTHQQTLTAAVTAYQTAVNAALATAKADCGNGTAAATLKAAVKSARQTLDAARKSDKVTGAIKQLATTRETTIKAANATFRASAKTNAQTLAAVLKTN